MQTSTNKESEAKTFLINTLLHATGFRAARAGPEEIETLTEYLELKKPLKRVASQLLVAFS